MATRIWTAGDVRLAVDEVALACCAAEVAGALPPVGAGPVDAHVLVVAGTVSRGALATVIARFEALPEPRRVIAFGACATSGGPYWDSYSVVQGIGGHLPVDVVVPGCPPRPHLLESALQQVAELVLAEAGTA